MTETAAKPAEPSLDAAWAEAETALPKGWAIYLRPDLGGPGWNAQGRVRGIWMMAYGSLPSIEATGPTPAAALHALAAKLTEAGR